MRNGFKAVCTAALLGGGMLLGNCAAYGEGGTELAVPSVEGALHVDGTVLKGSTGNPVQLKGISTHGLSWFPEYVNEESFRQFRDEWNVNVMRLAMYTADYNGYCTGGDQEALKELVRSGVSYAVDNDMYVIIDWHILSDHDPNTYKAEAMDFFREMAAEYADCDNVLYEICNEPNSGTSWSEVKAYAEEVIPVIRAEDEDGIIIVGTPNWCQFVDEAAADPITGYDNIMYTLHFYAASHKEDLRNKMTAAIDAGLPIFVTEYGICDASGNGAIDEEEADRWVETMDRYGISYLNWSLCNKDESASMLKPSCIKVSGFTEEDLSTSGKWLHRMLTSGAGASGTDSASDPAVSEDESASESAATDAESASDPAAVGSENASDPAAPGSENASYPAPSGSENASASAVCRDEDLSCSVTLKNSWEADGRQFAQYDLSITNNGSGSCGSWEAEIHFENEIQMSDGWNGDYAAEGTILHVTPKDYNADIGPGQTVGDIGFIVSGTVLPQVVS